MTILKKKNYSHLDKASKNCKKLFKIYYSQLWSHSWVVVITIIAASSVTSDNFDCHSSLSWRILCARVHVWVVISDRFIPMAGNWFRQHIRRHIRPSRAGRRMFFLFFATWGCEVVSWPVCYDLLYTCVYIYTYTCVFDCSFCSLCAKIENPSYIYIVYFHIEYMRTNNVKFVRMHMFMPSHEYMYVYIYVCIYSIHAVHE